jgi:hypothetical protein
VTTIAAANNPRTKIVVPRLLPDGVGALLGCGAAVEMTVGSAKLKVNDPTNGASFSAGKL